MKYCFEKSTVLLLNVIFFVLVSQGIEAVTFSTAVCSGSAEMVKSYGETFHTADCNGDLIRVKSLTAQNQQVVNSVDDLGISAFSTAVCSGSAEMVKSYGETFHTAACNGNVIRVKFLIDQNPQIIDSVGEFGHSVLHWAAFNGKEKVVRELLLRGANVNSRNNEGEMPLHKACAQGDMQIVNLLINSGADINAATDDGSLPLYYAVEWGKVEVVQALLVLLETRDRLWAEKIRSSALRVAVEKNKLSIARLLVLSRAHERALDDKNTEPEALTQDDCKGCYEICGKEWPLHYAARYNSREAWFPLMKMGVLVNAQDNEGNTPLHYAARYDTPYLVKLLLDRGANHKLKNNKGETPLHCACLSHSVFNSKADKITMLLAAGAKPDEQNNEKKTCIDLVCPLEEQRDIDYLACLMLKWDRN